MSAAIAPRRCLSCLAPLTARAPQTAPCSVRIDALEAALAALQTAVKRIKQRERFALVWMNRCFVCDKIFRTSRKNKTTCSEWCDKEKLKKKWREYRQRAEVKRRRRERANREAA